MVEDLLTAARLEAGALSFEPQDVDLAEEVRTAVAPYLRTGAAITTLCPHLMVRADPLRLRQVIRNLVSNAVKHGGPTVWVEAQRRQDQVVVRVVDDGEGVSPEVEGRLFERFVHDGRRALLAGSVGLGLAVARELVESMGGRLTYTREGGRTVFACHLPAGSHQGGQVIDLGRIAASGEARQVAQGGRR